ncbi:hypothetical protein MSAN_00283400 [Mycena sanguinolenta]|uniref:Cytochrome P450 n=1 Tax=Mycena sanguinolenta TaxID=230812 RepID=A0A8H6Z7L7_9AGAR|nr:hypothetical protein MSAN_00283400 [Mycena sanguinolenta]
MMTGGLFFPTSHYGDTWRKMRRVAQEALSKNFTHKFHAIQAKEAILLTHSLLVDPTPWDSHLRRTTASTLLSMVYDTPPLISEKDPRIIRVNDFMERLGRAGYPGAYLVEYFTWMRYLPSWMAKWKRDVLEQSKIDDAMFRGLFNEVGDRVAQGDRLSGFSAHLLDEKDRHGLDEKESVWAAATLYGAGADTVLNLRYTDSDTHGAIIQTSVALQWCLFAILSFPEVQRRAQAELDAVVGRSRMPTFADYENLPYVRALIKETLRWAPLGPIGLPHRLMEDDYYDGYLIPKGSMTYNPNQGYEPGPGSIWSKCGFIRTLSPFGRTWATDRRYSRHQGGGAPYFLASGEANDSLFVGCANILWALSIEAFYDENGAPIIPSLDEGITPGIVIRPPEFRCSFKPRFPNVAEIVSNSKELIE